ncbi:MULTISPECIES: ribonuclease H family protein [Rhizobium]|uniref:ribonuclease H n=1 Tax=Rhizobium rhododendri TaxID=2506430 RepID=A0ABY8IFU7_9HYPH|nr:MULTISPECIES: ribonuclease H [Rhizobium]MBZ5762995.1 ribonuclease HI [Rhizobium sp. VS19-DR96]MBZ5768867.1 ribonuclease HI [Rhizobium sp. VS19-DR129.2]MBZ5776495.1 ribonuclease HI [Rhizobium sp. VS19-DRK62.2]MBZ5787651.1 ribonuclease HI [Rhizobium sp. VS19-DR121]MBZ5805176.1 ribonuclease HI [Rhizobium sp. VS19-DR181]
MTAKPTQPLQANPAAVPHGLHVFTDGCVEPGSGDGGWAYVVYRNGLEISSGCGGVAKTANNAMEIMAVLEAAEWIASNAAGEDVVIWSDSLYAVRGCNAFRQIWKGNGWKKIDANPNVRRRTIAHAELWKMLDLKLSQNPLVRIEWCKGHFGIDGNERADALADQGRRTIQRQGRRT